MQMNSCDNWGHSRPHLPVWPFISLHLIPPLSLSNYVIGMNVENNIAQSNRAKDQHFAWNHFLSLYWNLSFSMPASLSLSVCQPFLPNEAPAIQEVMSPCGRSLSTTPHTCSSLHTHTAMHNAAESQLLSLPPVFIFKFSLKICTCECIESQHPLWLQNKSTYAD